MASMDVNTWCCLWVHAGCCETAVRAFFALLWDHSRVTRTQFAPPERALFRTNGFCGAYLPPLTTQRWGERPPYLLPALPQLLPASA